MTTLITAARETSLKIVFFLFNATHAFSEV